MESSLSGGGGGETKSIEKAGWWRRFWAYALDWLILGLVEASLSWIVFPLIGDTVGTVLVLAITALYFVWPYSRGGQTLGKKVLGIRVVAIDGSPLNWRRGILRTVGYVPSMSVVGYLWSIWDRDKQAWHDKLAGTTVVREWEQGVAIASPEEAWRRQKRWLLGLGLPSLVVAVGGAAFFWSLIQGGIAEVNNMGPWPGPEVPSERAVAVDLTHLGLSTGGIVSARSVDYWRDGGYEDGTMASYHSGGEQVVVVMALKYASKENAARDFRDLRASVEAAGCRLYTSFNVGSTGLVRCQTADADNKVYWKDEWIIVIGAAEGTELPPEMLLNRVRDGVTAHWAALARP